MHKVYNVINLKIYFYKLDQIIDRKMLNKTNLSMTIVLYITN